MDPNVIQIGTVVVILVASAVSAIAASGLTVVALLMFFKSLLNSPAALSLIEGLVNSFPPQTRELIHVMAQFFEVVTDAPPLTAPPTTDPQP
ncbi:MAG: hypothetical protein ABI947_14495 [Chloroflexota bacterium]